MKSSKFWIWFIPLFLIVSIGIYLMLSKSTPNNTSNNSSDAIKIKEEYLNENNNYYNVNLNDKNVYKYISSDDFKELLEKKDGLVFIGDTKDNIARKNIVVLNDVVLSTSIPEVNYIDLKDIKYDLKDLIYEKTDLVYINGGTLISVEKGQVLKSFYPSYIKDNKELSDEEKDKLYKEYKDIVDNFIEECDENC